MKEALIELLPALVPTIGTLLSVSIACVIAALKARTAKHELALEKTQLEKTIYEGSYIICPHCGNKVYIRDVKFYVDK